MKFTRIIGAMILTIMFSIGNQANSQTFIEEKVGLYVSQEELKKEIELYVINQCLVGMTKRSFGDRISDLSDEDVLVLAKLATSDEHVEGLASVLLGLINVTIYTDPESFDELAERMVEYNSMVVSCVTGEH